MDTPLGRPEITCALETLPGWSYEPHRLSKTYEFPSFRAAMDFMLRASAHAEEMNHHPDWGNTYDTVRVHLTTHHAGNRVTARDVALARALEQVVRD